MNTTKSLPILAVALIATLATATAAPADDTLVLSNHQTSIVQDISAPVYVAQDCNNGACADDACCDGACGDACCDGACSYGPTAGARGFRANARASAAIAYSTQCQPLIDPWARADWIAQQRAALQSWHAGYYHTEWGAPVALMVPPTARMQTRWGWGVAQSTVSPIYPQFKRPYPGPYGGMMGMGTNPLRSTPRWPSHTDQFGVYYIRGPW